MGWKGPVWMASGALLGAALTIGLSTCSAPAALLEHLPEPMLARTLLAGSASDVVKSERYPEAIALYARPVPVSETLCRVVRYEFDRRASGDFSRAHFASVFYAILKAPDVSTTPVDDAGSPAPADEVEFSPQTTKACSEYGDFDHLVAGDSREIAQAVLLLETARWDAINGRAKFPVECRDGTHSGAAESCDGPALLRDLDLKQVARVSSMSGDSRNAEVKVSYRVQVERRINGHPIVTDIRISADRSPDATLRVTAVTIDRDAY